VRKIKIFWFLLILLICLRAFSQESDIKDRAAFQLPFEEIELVTDRDIYLSGDKIWFSANCDISGFESKQMSRVLYLELYNSSHNSVMKNKYRIINGKANGTLEIPSEYLSGNYFLRAYTQYLKNFPPESFFTRIITVVNPFLPIQKPISGNLIDTSVLDAERDFIIKTDLSNPEQLYVTINTNNASPDPGSAEYELIMASEDLTPVQKVRVFLNNEITHQSFSTNKLISGINYLILNDKSGKRLLFYPFLYRNIQQPGVETKPSKQKYKTRELVELDILPVNLDENEILDLSISVVKKGAIYDPEKLLTQLKQHPQIFKEHFLNIILNNNINNLTIEQYITHFGKLLNSGIILFPSTEERSDLNYLPDIRDVSINGIAIDAKTKETLSNVQVFLSAGKVHPQVHVYNTNSDGKFVFSLNNFEGFQELFLCPIRWNKDVIPEIKVFSDFLPDYPMYKQIPLLIDTSYYEMLEELLRNQQSSQAFKTEPGNDTINISHFPNSIDDPPITIVLDDYIQTDDMETVFRELVPRVRVRKVDDNYSLSVFDFYKEVYYDDPLILIDNIPVFDVNALIKVPPVYIEKIEVHNSPLIFGENVINGIIMITTNTDDFAGMVMPPFASFLKYQTLSPILTFDTPLYDTKEMQQSSIADFRTLLYWNPDLKVKSTKRIFFYTSDHKSEYDIIVRGRTSSGVQVYSKSKIVVD